MIAVHPRHNSKSTTSTAPPPFHRTQTPDAHAGNPPPSPQQQQPPSSSHAFAPHLKPPRRRSASRRGLPPLFSRRVVDRPRPTERVRAAVGGTRGSPTAVAAVSVSAGDGARAPRGRAVIAAAAAAASAPAASRRTVARSPALSSPRSLLFLWQYIALHCIAHTRVGGGGKQWKHWCFCPSFIAISPLTKKRDDWLGIQNARMQQQQPQRR